MLILILPSPISSFAAPNSDTNFCIERARQCARLFHGIHDFRTFMGAAQQNTDRDHAFFPLRSISHISIDPATPTCHQHSQPQASATYDYWDIRISGRSFLYRQVRRMVGVILAVAQNRLRQRDAYEMLTIPSMHSWCPQASAAPAFGLYLTRVDYDEQDKRFPEKVFVERQADGVSVGAEERAEPDDDSSCDEFSATTAGETRRIAADRNAGSSCGWTNGTARH